MRIQVYSPIREERRDRYYQFPKTNYTAYGCINREPCDLYQSESTHDNVKKACTRGRAERYGRGSWDCRRVEMICGMRYVISDDGKKRKEKEQASKQTSKQYRR